MQKNKNGFTLLELIVGIVIFIMLATIAGAFLLKKIDKARVANINENILNIRTAVFSYVSKNGDLKDLNNDNNYLDELIDAGYIEGNINRPSCSQWYIRKVTDENGKSAFVIEVDYTNCPAKVINYFKTLDQNTDDGQITTGVIRIFGQ